MFTSVYSGELLPAFVIGGVCTFYYLKFRWKALSRTVVAEGSALSSLQEWNEVSLMPKELRDSTLFMNELPVSTDTPVPFHGKVDQVFRTSTGMLILVDTKSRDSVKSYNSDVIQLSVYRFILARTYGSSVAMHAYVRILRGQFKPEVSYVRVQLLGDDAMVHLWREYNDIREGVFQPECTCGGVLCG